MVKLQSLLTVDVIDKAKAKARVISLFRGFNLRRKKSIPCGTSEQPQKEEFNYSQYHFHFVAGLLDTFCIMKQVHISKQKLFTLITPSISIFSRNIHSIAYIYRKLRAVKRIQQQLINVDTLNTRLTETPTPNRKKASQSLGVSHQTTESGLLKGKLHRHHQTISSTV